MTGCLRSLTAILALRMLLLPTSLLATAPGDAPSHDAVFVAMSVPEKVAACEVFPVTVTMRNTGTATWQGWPICLRSVNPRGNVTWGTDYILIAQDTAVKSGEEYTFRSNLRAPAETGKIAFQWQVCKDTTTWFSETTPPRSIEVTPGAAASTETATPPARVSDVKKVLTFEDFEYLGSFKPWRIGIVALAMMVGLGRLASAEPVRDFGEFQDNPFTTAALSVKVGPGGKGTIYRTERILDRAKHDVPVESITIRGGENGLSMILALTGVTQW